MKNINFKSGLLGFIIGAILFGSTGFVLAENKTVEAFYNNIKLVVNGKNIEMDVEPFIANGRTYVPARYVAEALGSSVSWDETNNAVVVKSVDVSATNIKGVVSLEEGILEKDGVKYIDITDVGKTCNRYNFGLGVNIKNLNATLIGDTDKNKDKVIKDIPIYLLEKNIKGNMAKLYYIKYDYYINTILPFLEANK